MDISFSVVIVLFIHTFWDKQTPENYCGEKNMYVIVSDNQK